MEQIVSLMGSGALVLHSGGALIVIIIALDIAGIIILRLWHPWGRLQPRPGIRERLLIEAGFFLLALFILYVALLLTGNLW
ncbi:hypothetical protein EPA93_06260 [Ktedonosporobacter rubrisoli]|uniref:Uncharacterized protein n=1 Tax=Ktedonosporobacter rubrisoli TaxID=2509675 RepID=A0A4P6JKD7_KTERU|nr:hypothetical protein [Ktedonosporobacter rubrisoli]QBD75628.1 hypothetical protein EPA93_06260 [Ktedonosporobacter rubrisoli]